MEILEALQTIRTPFLDTLFSLVTYLGHQLLVIGVVCVLLWCANREEAYRIGMAFFLGGLTLQSLKIACRIDRPWILDPKIKPVEQAVDAATGYSFPSGHSQGAASLFAGILPNIRKWWLRILAVLAIPAVMFARMYLGVHTLRDVLVGAAFGIASVLITLPLSRMLARTRRHDLTVAVIMAAVSAGAAVFTFILYGNGTIEDYANASDCLKSAGAGLAFALSWYCDRRWVRFDTRCARFWQQIVKCAIGAAVAFVLKECLKWIFGAGPAIDLIRYFIVVVWIILIYPWLWQRIVQKGAKAPAVGE